MTRLENVWRLGIGALLALGLTVVVPGAGAAQEATFEAVNRIAGADRFETAAAVSAERFSTGVRVAYVTTGTNFPDAIAAGAVAATEGGPVLLVRPESVPTATRQELNRLRPGQIFLVGGEGAVGAAVEAVLGTIAPTTRIAGANRYETAAAISSDVFSPEVDVVYVATGEAFPDALGAGAAAGAEGSPVLIVRPHSIPISVQQELARLQPKRIVVVGGEMAVGSDVENALGAFTDGEVTRLAGRDRYATAEAIASAVFPTPLLSSVYVATGLDFADGLAAVPAAVARGVPVLLVERDRVPTATIRAISGLAPRSLLLLGGSGAVSDQTAAALEGVVVGAGGVEPPITAGPFLRPGPNPNVPLVAQLQVETAVPTRIDVEISGGGTASIHSFDELDTDHELPILGLAPGATNTVEVTVVDGGGSTTSSQSPATITPARLPEDFPSLEVTTRVPSSIEPGVTLFDVTRADQTLGGFLVIVDSEGRVRWYLDSDQRFHDTRRLANGNLLLSFTNRVELIEMDMLGNIVASWYPSSRGTGLPGSIPVLTDSFHHEIYPLDSGTFATLSSEVRPVPDFPTSETDLTPRTDPVNVAGDAIVEFATDGTIIGKWQLLDLVDPTRIGYDSFGPFWDSFYPELAPTYDWAHANGLVHDPSDDTFIVSLRHQDAIIKFTRSGELVWILGPPENWVAPFDGALLSASGTLEWPYHPHAPMLTPAGTVLVHDNGVHRASPPDPKLTNTTTRAVEYSIDPVTMTVEQVWEYDPGNLYSPFLGDADALLTTGNVLVTFGSLSGLTEGDPSVRLVEVTHDATPVVVWELVVADDNPSGNANRVVYRSQRLPGLYPWVPGLQ